jgi:hypothetical protein
LSDVVSVQHLARRGTLIFTGVTGDAAHRVLAAAPELFWLAPPASEDEHSEVRRA